MTELSELMNEFGQELDVILSPDNLGHYEIPLEEKLSIKVFAVPQGISIFSAFMPVPPINKELLYGHFLNANLFGQGTHGSAVGMTEDGKMLTLSKLLDYAVSYKDFRDNLEDFINIVDFLRNEANTFNKK